MIEDAELLRRYVNDHSESAFAELVERHVNLVYFAALRQVGGDSHRARDVVQTVFTDLARKARALSSHAVLTGWLYTSTHYAAAKVVRSELRRSRRELEAHLMQENSHSSNAAADWDRLRPVLDDVLLALNERDREAVLLRYFEGRPFADVGQKLRLTEDAARMRVDRALEKLRALLTKRGVTSTTAALSIALAQQGALAAPAGLAGAITGAALSGAAVSAGSAVGFVTFFAMNKSPLILSTVLAATAVGGVIVQGNAASNLQRELVALRAANQQIDGLQREQLLLARTADEVARLRDDDVELARLRTETAALKARSAEAMRLRAEDAARRARSGGVASENAQPKADPTRLDRVPRPKVQVTPAFPEEMRAAGVSGRVMVSFVVDATGAVRNAFASSSTRREFEAAAMEAVSQWQFDPGSKGGRMVNTRMQIPVTFRAENSDGSESNGLPLISASQSSGTDQAVRLSEIVVSSADAASTSESKAKGWF